MVNPNDGRPNGLRRRITSLGGFDKKQVRMGRRQNRESRWKKLHKLLANSTVEVCAYQFLQEFRGIGCTFQGLYQGADLVNCEPISSNQTELEPRGLVATPAEYQAIHRSSNLGGRRSRPTGGVFLCQKMVRIAVCVHNYKASLGGGFTYFFIFHPEKLGKISNLTSIFFRRVEITSRGIFQLDKLLHSAIFAF